jgi:hypothetical protein
MAGIVFLKTEDLKRIVGFYTRVVGMSVWLEQPGITILRHENLLIGFQQHSTSDIAGVSDLLLPREAAGRCYVSGAARGRPGAATHQRALSHL